jgi:predicted AlkP superfamily pyrophosphatase or phosphodiesterase
LLACLACSTLCGPRVATAAEAPAAGKNTVLWISVDGNRGDYVDRGQSPFLKSLMEHGAYTKQLVPIFPSLTFPSHVSEATGVGAGLHGIVSNKFKDTSLGQEYNMPSDPNLLQAEPIWITAARQGVRSAVWDWPLSQKEDKLPAGSPHATIFNPSDKFDQNETDTQRLENLVDVYRKDFDVPNHQEPLRLLMGYCFAIDHAGHVAGPEAEATTKAVHEADQVLQKIVEEVADIFQKHAQPGDKLYVLITADHGMDTVKTLVNARKLIGGADVPDSVVVDTSGSLANVYLNDVPGPQRDAVKQAIIARLKDAPFVKFWLREDLPEKFAYANNSRTGDIVINMQAGYDFSTHIDGITAPAESDARAMKGMHGYDPAEDRKMLGFAVLSCWGSELPGKDLGEVSTLRLHPTVAKLLGIKPAAGASAPTIEAVP